MSPHKITPHLRFVLSFITLNFSLVHVIYTLSQIDLAFHISNRAARYRGLNSRHKMLYTAVHKNL